MDNKVRLLSTTTTDPLPYTITTTSPSSNGCSGSENDEPLTTSKDPFDQHETGLTKQCQRKLNFEPFPPSSNKHLPATVARRNARERNRVKQVNNGFASLKHHIPPEHRAKKMSKVETLRCAVDYIRRLQLALDRQTEGTGGGGPLRTDSPHFNNPSMSPGQSSQFPLTSPSSSNSHQLNHTDLYKYDLDLESSADEDELLDAISIWQQS